MDIITLLANNPTMAILGLAGLGLVAFSILVSRTPAPIRIPVRINQRRRN